MEVQLRRRAVLNRLSKAKEGSKEQGKLLAAATRIAGEALTRCRGENEGGSGVLGGKPPGATHGWGSDSEMLRSKRHGFPDTARLDHITSQWTWIRGGGSGKRDCIRESLQRKEVLR